MAGSVERLLVRNDVSAVAPVSRSCIDDVARIFGAALPAPLIEFWSASDGVVLDSLEARLLGPIEVVRMVEAQEWPAALVDLGYVPLLDDEHSNYLGAIVKGHAAYRVAHLHHEGEYRLLYRDFDSFLGGLCQALDASRPQAHDPDEIENADAFFGRTPGDYPPDAPRTPQDRAAARALMVTDGKHFEWNYAVQLLDAKDLAEWAVLLETHHFVRRDVVARMKLMTAPEIQGLLRRDLGTFEQFAVDLSRVAREAGLKVGRRRENNLQVGGIWIMLDGFFYRRRIPSAFPRMLAWIEDLIAGRNPHDRPGHFMSD